MPIEGVMPVAKLTVRLRQMAEDAGRDPSEITVYLSGAPKDPAKLESYLEAGLDGIALGVSWDADLDTAKRELDENVEFRDRYLS